MQFVFHSQRLEMQVSFSCAIIGGHFSEKESHDSTGQEKVWVWMETYMKAECVLFVILYLLSTKNKQNSKCYCEFFILGHETFPTEMHVEGGKWSHELHAAEASAEHVRQQKQKEEDKLAVVWRVIWLAVVRQSLSDVKTSVNTRFQQQLFPPFSSSSGQFLSDCMKQMLRPDIYKLLQMKSSALRGVLEQRSDKNVKDWNLATIIPSFWHLSCSWRLNALWLNGNVLEGALQKGLSDVTTDSLDPDIGHRRHFVSGSLGLQLRHSRSQSASLTLTNPHHSRNVGSHNALLCLQ